MRRLILAVWGVLVAAPLFGAVQYEFRQVTVSDSQLRGPVIIVGRAVIDGNQSRVDYLEGSTVGTGNYVISHGATRDLTLVNPEKKAYLARHTVRVSEDQPLKFSVSGLKLDFKDMGNGPAIAGYPTRYYRLVAHYNVSIKVGALDLEQAVETTVEKWTTSVFGDVAAAFFSANPTQSGNQDVDRLMEAELSKIPGLPLRQIVTVIARLNDSALAHNSELKVNPSRTQRTEMVVTKVGRTNVAEGMFEIPPGYADISQQKDADVAAAVHVLSLTDDN